MLDERSIYVRAVKKIRFYKVILYEEKRTFSLLKFMRKRCERKMQIFIDLIFYFILNPLFLDFYYFY